MNKIHILLVISMVFIILSYDTSFGLPWDETAELLYSYNFIGFTEEMTNPLAQSTRDYTGYPVYGNINIWSFLYASEIWERDLFWLEISGEAKYVSVLEEENMLAGEEGWYDFFIDDIVRLEALGGGLSVFSSGIDSAPSDSYMQIDWQGQNNLFLGLYSDVGPWIDVNPVLFVKNYPVPEPSGILLFIIGALGITGLSKQVSLRSGPSSSTTIPFS